MQVPLIRKEIKGKPKVMSLDYEKQFDDDEVEDLF